MIRILEGPEFSRTFSSSVANTSKGLIPSLKSSTLLHCSNTVFISFGIGGL